jgi:thiol-disulfide isomerase/thioredoxin
MKCQIILLLLLNSPNLAWGQQEVPSIILDDINGKSTKFMQEFAVKDRLYVVSFWATWCAPCVTELDELADQYDLWKESLDFEMIAISVDDARTQTRVKPFVNGKAWPFAFLMDTNQDLKRRLGINDVPHTLIVKNNKILFTHVGYSAGDENDLFEQLKKLK